MGPASTADQFAGAAQARWAVRLWRSPNSKQQITNNFKGQIENRNEHLLFVVWNLSSCAAHLTLHLFISNHSIPAICFLSVCKLGFARKQSLTHRRFCRCTGILFSLVTSGRKRLYPRHLLWQRWVVCFCFLAKRLPGPSSRARWHYWVRRRKYPFPQLPRLRNSPNSKQQITNNKQISNDKSKILIRTCDLEFVCDLWHIDWNLFVICCLGFVI